LRDWKEAHYDCPPGGGLSGTPGSDRSGRGVGAIPVADDCIRLRAFLPFDYVEFDLIAFFERFVSIQLNCRVVNEYIRPIFTSDESVALGIVEPLDLTFVLSHSFLPSCSRAGGSGETSRGSSHRYLLRRGKTQKG
jgi:hypothetical protein